MASALAPAAKAKNNRLRFTSRKSMRPRRHQAMPSNTNGRGATAALLTVARPKAPAASQYHRLRPVSSNVRYDKREQPNRTRARVFFRSAIHATRSEEHTSELQSL